MARVLVVGGGVAGIAAAISASREGARVTIAEGCSRMAHNKGLLPQLLSSGVPPAGLDLAYPDELWSRYGIEARTGDPVLSVDCASRIARTRLGRLEFDALVLGTGSVSHPNDLRGASKQGVYTMRSFDDYVALSEDLGNLSHVALLGPLPASLILAEAVSRRSTASVFLGAGALPQFTQRALRRIAEAASPRGVRLLHERVDAVVGMKCAEAVLSEGAVHPCDGVVVLPRTSPSLPNIDCVRGDRGGAVVDESMRTSCRNVYAAGDCAEIACGTGSLPSRLHSSSIVMGDAAGNNAAGGLARAAVSRCIALEIFGVELCSAGIEPEPAREVGLDVVEFVSACEEGKIDVSVVFDRVTRRLYGAQVVGQGSLQLADYVSLAVSSGASLDDLAYQESPYLSQRNRERSPISLTAGLALVQLRG